ncbi:MAG TPA: 1-(5-phosphoribosyl)-5-[(5-phosphoribosylamino)methylideneamino] imidazole-4-carboxamide isomerase [Rhodanobacteraceae bacterium]|nr:1-(5-phosphoribosyl)-5-[(5-phosphoribosylamino)methylideneamino] imidazole-4-carboxamide isomerase [Rhodanobacteraceae bacterium]
MRIIPAIDLRGGRVVRLRQGDFARVREFDHDPTALAERYVNAGAEWIHVVDLDGARAGTSLQTEAVARIARTGARVQAGGGARTLADVEWLLAVGASRVVVGSVAVREPATFVAWLDALGADRLCLAIDLRVAPDGAWRPAIDAWQSSSDADAHALIDRFAAAGLRHALSTNVARDGMREGPSLELYRELASRWPALEWIASGGVRDYADVAALRDTGVAACVAGSALLDGTLALEEIARCSRAA